MKSLIPKIPSSFVLNYIETKLLTFPEYGVVVGTQGFEVGSLQQNGYVYITIYDGTGKNKLIKRANIIWYETYNFWPTSGLDHINRIRTDDRLSNLRMISQKENVRSAMPIKQRIILEAREKLPKI